jgi:prepilin-type N-terminal cleavage/methylation domain-containing protein
MSKRNDKCRDRGFTLIEVMVATFVLTIGLISVAALATTMLATGKRSKYMALASTLASEKLEDLSRYPADVPQVCIPTGNTTAGSLTTDSTPASVTCPKGDAGTVFYNDDVNISLGTSASTGGNCPNEGGCFAETVSGLNGTSTVYATTYHSPDGVVSTPAATSSKPSNMTFHRRWLIEGDTPVAGVRRVTVVVSLIDNSVKPAVQFQMSMVRP